eukprot:768537-Hanusia_phi.AAC.16
MKIVVPAVVKYPGPYRTIGGPVRYPVYRVRPCGSARLTRCGLLPVVIVYSPGRYLWAGGTTRYRTATVPSAQLLYRARGPAAGSETGSIVRHGTVRPSLVVTGSGGSHPVVRSHPKGWGGISYEIFPSAWLLRPYPPAPLTPPTPITQPEKPPVDTDL